MGVKFEFLDNGSPHTYEHKLVHYYATLQLGLCNNLTSMKEIFIRT
jgi:hypothetical protein